MATEVNAEPRVIPGPLRDDLLVVGLGASAGGIDALKQFFQAAQPDGGIAYVVILHLSPEHESHLQEVLAGSTPLKVTPVRDRARLEAGHVYVVSPNHKLEVTDGEIRSSPLANREERRAPIDMFFRTLADARQTSAVSVVLSGTGSDGSMGLKRVKEHGGLCIAQEPLESEFADMPRNAIATGLIDYVLPAREMPARIAAYRRHIDKLDLPADDDEAADVDQALVDVFTQLRVRTGHDFTNYKRSTVMRRIERRMNVHELQRLPEYARFLRDNRDEAPALLADLLISVTNFFRDGEAFAALQATVVPRLFAGKGVDDHVRVWVPGCATGEEAYSVAMVLAEYAQDRLNGPEIQVFASDIDEQALAKARAGYYTLADTADVSPERLRRFFQKEGEGFRVQRELREMVLFAAHNVTKDPPFSHLDLVSCRNLLIYLTRPAQERILKLFHFGLNAGGYLFLGTSESAEDIANLFTSVDKEHHIFQSRGVDTPLALPPVAATPQPMPRRDDEDRGGADRAETRLRERLSYQELHQRLLEQYAPPSVVVNREYDILHLSERAGRYLQFVGGEPSQNLLKVVRPELRLELHSALYQALQQKDRVRITAGPIVLDGHEESVEIVVSPVVSELDVARGLLLVVFQAVDAAPSEAKAARTDDAAGEPLARQLEEELVRVKLHLRTTIEHHELQQEELKASNEELQAMNEELRSSSEELETSKEELQSVNEELTTVNQELKIKIDELSQASNDTRNLMNSTDLATVFIDRAMRIKLFTPKARAIFNVIPADTGRPLLDITHRLDYREMAGDVERVLEKLAVCEREVRSNDGLWYIARVLPYRTAEDRIAGVVLTFTDITERKRAEEALRASEERVRLVVESVPEYAIFTMDTDGRIEWWNAGAREMFGYPESEVVGQPMDLLFTAEDRAAGMPARELQQAREHGRATNERWHLHKDGSRMFLSGVTAPLYRDREITGYTKVARDLTERRRHEEALRKAHDELEARVEERTLQHARVNDALRNEMAERRQLEDDRIGLLRQVVNAQEVERRRISRELHDQLGQEITAVGLYLASLKEAPDLSPAIRDRFESLEKVVKQLDGDLEFLVWQLRPTGLDDVGLVDALDDYVGAWTRKFGVPVRYEPRLARRLDEELETVFYRIVQEALNNVAKHAAAKHVAVRLEEAAGKVVLAVEDDGKGFDASKLMPRTSLGLVGIRERAALVGGTATVESKPGSGTRIRIEVPRR